MTHWTEDSGAYIAFIRSDFVTLLHKHMDNKKRKKFADHFNITDEVINVFLLTKKFSLEEMVDVCRLLGLKLSIVVYDDKDPDNNNGPVLGEVLLDFLNKVGFSREQKDINSVNDNKSIYDEITSVVKEELIEINKQMRVASETHKIYLRGMDAGMINIWYAIKDKIWKATRS